MRCISLRGFLELSLTTFRGFQEMTGLSPYSSWFDSGHMRCVSLRGFLEEFTLFVVSGR